MTESPLDSILKGTEPPEQKKISGEFISSGFSASDPVLSIPALANHFRSIAETQERNTKATPRLFSDRLDQHEKVITETLEKIEAAKVKPSLPAPKLSFYGFCPISIGAGVLISIAIMIPVFSYWLVPSEVSKQRGADWAIAEYLTSPSGRVLRKSFDKCHKAGKPGCKL